MNERIESKGRLIFVLEFWLVNTALIPLQIEHNRPPLIHIAIYIYVYTYIYIDQ